MAIKTIAIVHHVHTDFGYTDHQERCKREQVKYIHQAIDYILKTSDYPVEARFAWTQEQLYQVREFWESAEEKQKERFLEALKTGRLEITGTPFNVTAFMSREEWETAMNWISPELWEECNIKTAMQIDVNGMHTPGMECAYDKGIRNLWMGPNSYYTIVSIDSKSVTPRDERAAEGMKMWNRMLEPLPQFAEQCYFHQFEKEGKAEVYNPKLKKGMSLKYDVGELPHFTQWKQMGIHDYVLGMEPGSCNPIGRIEAEKNEQLLVLLPGETKTFKLDFQFYE